MTAMKPIIQIMIAVAVFTAASLKHVVRAAKGLNKLAILAPALALLISFTGLTAQVQSSGTVDCVIASNDGQNRFRTDEISGCRVDTKTGNSAFIFKGEKRTRSYASVDRLTTRHLKAAAFWLNRVGRLRFPANANPAGFDPQEFLRAASQATHGFVLTRNKQNGARTPTAFYANTSHAA